MRRGIFLATAVAATALCSGAWAQTQAPAAAAEAARAAPERPAAPAAAAESPAPRRQTIIEARNELERALIAATDVGAGDEERAAFRRLFLDSQVALALSATDPAAPPRQIQLHPGVSACVIFTSSARATEVMGDDAARIMLSGREALARVRGANLIININLRPYITLDADGIEGFLALPAEAEPAAPEAEAPATPDESAGPVQ